MPDTYIDYSYISTFAGCPRRGYYRYERRLEPPGGVNIPMYAGSVLHEATHVYHVAGPDAARRKLIEAWGETVPHGQYAWLTRGHCEIVLQNYMEDVRQEKFVPIDFEGVSLGEVALTHVWDGLPVGGKPDAAIRLGGGLYVVDRKFTTADVTDWWGQKFVLSHQLRLYMVLLQELTGQRFAGAYIFGCHMGEKAADPPEKWKGRRSRRSRMFGPFTFSPSQLRETRDWLAQWLVALERWRETGFPQNEGQQCSSCEYFALCKAPVEIRENMMKTHFVVRDLPEGTVLASGAA